MTSLAAAILDFQNFFIFDLKAENMKNVRSIVKLSVFRHDFSKNSHSFSAKLNFRCQHTSCVSYYDDVFNCDVT